MQSDKKLPERPDYLFETSWEVCNKLGGIHTVVSTKAKRVQENYGNSYILIGPDLNKGESGNIEFIEDGELLKEWRAQFNVDGLKIRIGRWDIPGKPMVVLVDFSPLFSVKDQIFSWLWTKNKLDSLLGGWEYIEPALFGVASGKVIENFSKFYIQNDCHVLAHFHEWMTGAGVLYLANSVPEISTVFTTHATFTGRSLCGNGQPFYSRFETYKGDQVAKEFGITAQHSLEKTAAITADTFTTVSENTANECQQLLGKAVDKVAPNGFDDFFLPNLDQFEMKRAESRKLLLKVASAVLGRQVEQDAFLVATSGRYEYRNKGIDLYIDALTDLDQKEKVQRQIIAFVIVPANHASAIAEVGIGMQTGHYATGNAPIALTHYLKDPDHDLILNQIKEAGFTNTSEDKVQVIYAPIYLDGQDGIFNSTYYDVLIGLDLTVFPSYYEPFGYTPLESLAFHVPTVTTTLTGFGQQVKHNLKAQKEGMLVIERSDFNDRTVTEQIANHIAEFSAKNPDEIRFAREEAFKISRPFLWANLLPNYDKIYRVALERNAIRTRTLERLKGMAPKIYVAPIQANNPIWKSVMVKFKVPDGLKDLERLAKNLWWTWHSEAEALFASIDPERWEKSNHNPLCLLGALEYEQFLALEKDGPFRSNLKQIASFFDAYMDETQKREGPKVAYLCMEYGLHESIPIYSGGLGILAGDYLKEASDQNNDIVAFGLLYRYGYFNQSFTLHGDQVAQYVKQHFAELPISPVNDEMGNRMVLALPLRSAMINVEVWRMQVGRVALYLFDTDIPENSDENKSITHRLYGGDNENRFRQEFLLAASTLQLLQKLQLKPDLFHYNEGHTAFTGLIRIVQLVLWNNLSFEEAVQVVKASTLFTTHTPVPAGQDVFGEDILRGYQGHFADTVNIPWEQFLGLGKRNPKNREEKFSMTYLAARMAGEINAVSEIHAEITRDLLSPIWPGFLPEELEIRNVTNGVHYATWTAPEWHRLFVRTFGNAFPTEVSHSGHWTKVEKISSRNIMEIKIGLKKKMITAVKKRLIGDMRKVHLASKQMYGALNSIDENDLIIGFARRFTTYKRPNLLFRDEERLAKLLNDGTRPVKLIFAGKAHPADGGGQDLIKRIMEISMKPAFLGKIFFVPNYDMALARLLVQGCDVWLNTPERGNEASGTSGMKAVLNGTLNCSVLDGWWAEAYREDAGWCLSKERNYERWEDQNDFDAGTLYNILEHEIIPEYFERSAEGLPEKWIGRIKNAFKHIAPNFTTARMIRDYTDNYYQKMFDRVQKMRQNDYKMVKKLVEWSNMCNAEWGKISVVDIQVPDGVRPLELGDSFELEIVLDLAVLTPNDIGVEMVLAKRKADGQLGVYQVQELGFVSQNKHNAVYKGSVTASLSGTFQYDIRFFPKNKWLTHRRDLPLVEWI